MASPLTPRTIRPAAAPPPSTASQERDTAPDPFVDLRPRPVAPVGDRIRSWFEQMSLGGGLAAGTRSRRDRGDRGRLAGHDQEPDPSDTDRGASGRRAGGVVRVLASVVAVVVVAGVAWWLLRPPAAPIETVLPLADGGVAMPANLGGSAPVGGSAPPSIVPGDPEGATTTSTPALVVQAAGAVASPGVYRMSPGARIDDLIRSAGGVTAEADTDRVNLAAPLADGQRVWVPRRGETEVPTVVAGGTPPGPATGGGAGADGASPPGTPTVVDLNTATADELDTLPGVGPATATAILAYRDTNGPFTSVDELLEVRGIGEAKLEQLRPLVRV